MQAIKDMASNALGGNSSGPAGPQGGVPDQGAPTGQHSNDSTSNQQAPQTQQQQQQQSPNTNGSNQVVEYLVLHVLAYSSRDLTAIVRCRPTPFWYVRQINSLARAGIRSQAALS